MIFNKQVEATLANSKYGAVAFQAASQFDKSNFTSDTKRQLKKVGKRSLSDEEMKNLSSIISQAEQIYSKVKSIIQYN